MRQAGRYIPEYRQIRAKNEVMDICRNPQLSAIVSLLPIEKLDVDAAIIFADIMLPLESLGIKFELIDGVGPVVKNPVRNMSDVESLTEINIKESTPFVFEAIRITLERLNGRVPLIGFSGAPFTLAGYMIEGKPTRDFVETKKLMYNHPEAWNLLLLKLSKMVVNYLNLQIDAGAHAIQIFDSWVGFLGPNDYREFVLPHSRRIFKALEGKNVPVIHFGTGTSTLLELMKEAGGDVIGVDWRIPLNVAWQRIGYEKGIQGNMDPAILLGSARYVTKCAAEILNQAENRPGHIFNLGHGVLPETEVKNVIHLVKTVHELGKNG